MTDETEKFTLDFKFTEDVVVEIEVRYPKGRALAGIQALSNAAEPGTLIQILAGLDDPSITQHLSDLGLSYGDEDDDDDYI